MKWVVRVVRTLLGLGFVAQGVIFFGFPEIIPQPEPSQDPGQQMVQDYGKILVASKYMAVVKVLETLGGLLLLSGRFTPLGVVVLMPIAVNILLFELLLSKEPGPGVVITGLLVVVMFGYRRHFAPFFVPTKL